MDLNFRSGYAGKCVIELLQLAKSESETTRRMADNKNNRANAVEMINNIKGLTVGKVYYMGKVLLGPHDLAHARQLKRYKADELEVMMGKHTISYYNLVTKVNGVFDE